MSAMRARTQTVLLTAALLSAACGSDGPGSAPLGGNDDDAGNFVPGDGGLPAEDQDGPLITVKSPKAAADPVTDEVVLGTTLEVTCQVRQREGFASIDSGTIKAVLFAGEEKEAKATALASSTGADDLYTATLQLAEVPHGAIRVGCTADDLEKKTGYGLVSTFLDKGPTISFVTPQANTFLRKTKIPIVLNVVPAPLSAEDSEADVTGIKLLVGNEELELKPEGTPNRYQAAIDLSKTLNPPSTLAIYAEATNKRSPTLATATLALSLPIDAQAPEATITTPDRTKLVVVGPRFTVKATVTDPPIGDGSLPGSGVDDATVQINIGAGGKNTPRVMRREGTTTTYSYTVDDVAQFLPEDEFVVQLRLTVSANDLAGNELTGASGTVVQLDTVPPFVSLNRDSVIMREKYASGDKYKCTTPFSPIGSGVGIITPSSGASVDTGTLKVVSPIFRAFVWDRSLPTGGIDEYYTQIDGESVDLYIQGDLTVPLFVDSDNDPKNECDGINPTLIDKSLDLLPIKPAGKGTLATSEANFSQTPVVAGCTPEPLTTKPPEALCDGDSDLTVAVAHDSKNTVATLYGINVNTAQCTGGGLAIGTPGWKCLAAVARDAAGNTGISDAYKVCFTLGDSKACSSPAPSCTDGCKIPALWASPAAVDGVRSGVPGVLVKD